jgi:hypothetical protein
MALNFKTAHHLTLMTFKLGIGTPREALNPPPSDNR